MGDFPLALSDELHTNFKNTAKRYVSDDMFGSLYNIYLLYDMLPFSDPDMAYKRFLDASTNPTMEKTRDVWIPPNVYARLTASESALLYRKMDLKLTVRAAVMDIAEKRADGEGKEKALKVVFPGVREEKVEQALLKIAIDGNGFYLDDNRMGVRFTLGEVQRVLELGKSKLSKAEIKEAILILGRSEFTVTARHQDEERRIELARKGYRLNNLTSVNIDDYQSARKTKEIGYHSVVFHELISASLRENAIRVSNFASHCQLNKPISRQIHSELRLNFTYAGHDRGAYRLSLLRTFSAMGRTSRGVSEDLKDLRKALDELSKAGIIKPFDRTIHQHKLKDAKGTFIDYEFEVFGSESFVKEMILANTMKKENEEKVLDFTQFKKRQQDNELSLEQRSMLRKINELFHLVENKSRELIKQHGLKRLQRAIDYTQLRLQSKRLDNPTAYFLSVLEHDYDAIAVQQEEAKVSLSDFRKERLGTKEKEFVNAMWPKWTEAEKAHVNQWGLEIAHMQKAFREWSAKH